MLSKSCKTQATPMSSYIKTSLFLSLQNSHFHDISITIYKFIRITVTLEKHCNGYNLKSCITGNCLTFYCTSRK